MDRACGAYGGEEKYMQDFGRETWRKETIWQTTVACHLFRQDKSVVLTALH